MPFGAAAVARKEHGIPKGHWMAPVPTDEPGDHTASDGAVFLLLLFTFIFTFSFSFSLSFSLFNTLIFVSNLHILNCPAPPGLVLNCFFTYSPPSEDMHFFLPCRGRPAVVLPIAPPPPIASAAVHCDHYAAYYDCAAVLPFIAPPPLLSLPIVIVPLPSLSPIMKPADAHCCRRRPSIAPLSVAPPPFISHSRPSAAVQSHCLAGCLWVGSSGERGWWSWQQWERRRQEISNVENMIGGCRHQGIFLRRSSSQLLVTVAEMR